MKSLKNLLISSRVRNFASMKQEEDAFFLSQIKGLETKYSRMFKKTTSVRRWSDRSLPGKIV